jgi:hypothetical protein
MKRHLPIIGGILLAFAGAAGLFLAFAVTQGANDGEWGHISRTGLPSSPEKFTWSEWQKNDGSIEPFDGFKPLDQPASLTEFRIGTAHNLYIEFTAYQGRFDQNGNWQTFPAIGPNWGARFRPLSLSCIILGFGAGLLFLNLYLRISKEAQPERPANRAKISIADA